MARTRSSRKKAPSPSPAKRTRSKTPVGRRKTPSKKKTPTKAAATKAASGTGVPIILDVEAPRLFLFIGGFYAVLSLGMMAMPGDFIKNHGLDMAKLKGDSDVPASDYEGWMAGQGLHNLATSFLLILISRTKDAATMSMASTYLAILMTVQMVVNNFYVADDMEAFGMGMSVVYFYNAVYFTFIFLLTQVPAAAPHKAPKGYPMDVPMSYWALRATMLMNLSFGLGVWVPGAHAQMVADFGYTGIPSVAMRFLDSCIRGSSFQMLTNVALIAAVIRAHSHQVVFRTVRAMWAWNNMAFAFFCAGKTFNSQGNDKRIMASNFFILFCFVNSFLSQHAMTNTPKSHMS